MNLKASYFLFSFMEVNDFFFFSVLFSGLPFLKINRSFHCTYVLEKLLQKITIANTSILLFF